MIKNESLFRTRRFWPLFWTQFLGAFNDNFLKNALIVAITYQGIEVWGIPPSQMVALGGGLFILPFFLFSATAGQLAEKLEKTRIVCWVKLSEVAIMLLASVGFLLPRYELALLALFFMGAHSAFFGPIKYSILPQHLHTNELVEGNAYVEAGTFLAILLGTLAGGILIAWSALWTSAGLISLAVAGLAVSRRIPSAPATAPDLKVEWNLWTPTLRILRQTRTHPEVHFGILGISWFWLFGAVMLSLLPVLSKDELQASAGVVTFFLALFSIGIGVGAVFCDRVSRGRIEWGLVPMGAFGMSVFTFILAFLLLAFDRPDLGGGGVISLLRSPVGAAISLSLFGVAVCGGLFTVPLYALIQERSPPEFRSRTIAANNILNAIFMVAGSIALMILFAVGVPLAWIFFILAATNGIASWIVYRRVPEFFYRLLVFFLSHFFYRFRVFHAERIPLHGPAILVCNHVSYVDWMLISAATPRPIRFVMDHQFYKGWAMKKFSEHAKVIPIATGRESPKLLQRAMDQISEGLRQGDLIGLFPEGFLTRDGKLQPLRPGIEKILARDPVPVIPMVLRGLWGSFFSREGGRAILKRPKRFRASIELHVGEPLSGQGLTSAHLEAVMRELLRRTYPDPPSNEG